MKTQHTPGPWHCISGAVYADPEATKPIAFMCRDERATEAGIYPVERDTNAHLIAAAPDLLEALVALKDIASYYHTGEKEGHLDACENPDCCGHCKAMRLVDAAIAKAERGTP